MEESSNFTDDKEYIYLTTTQNVQYEKKK